MTRTPEQIKVNDVRWLGTDVVEVVEVLARNTALVAGLKRGGRVPASSLGALLTDEELVSMGLAIATDEDIVANGEELAAARLVPTLELGPGQAELPAESAFELETTERTAAELALDKIAALCGCPSWDYPGQVVRDVEALLKQNVALGSAATVAAVGDDQGTAFEPSPELPPAAEAELLEAGGGALQPAPYLRARVEAPPAVPDPSSVAPIAGRAHTRSTGAAVLGQPVATTSEPVARAEIAPVANRSAGAPSVTNGVAVRPAGTSRLAGVSPPASRPASDSELEVTVSPPARRSDDQ